MFLELRGKVKFYEEIGMIMVFDVLVVVIKFDIIVFVELRKKLRYVVIVLEEVLEEEKDWYF